MGQIQPQIFVGIVNMHMRFDQHGPVVHGLKARRLPIQFVL